MPDLQLQYHDCLASVSADDWKMLMPSYPDSHAYLSLLDSVGMDSFLFKSIVISDETGPLLYLPLFLTRLDVSTLLDGALGKISRLAARVVPGWTALPLLGVGMVEAEWSQPGVRPNTPAAILHTAWRMAVDGLVQIGRQHSASLLAWHNFREDALCSIPRDIAGSQHSLATYPCALLPLPAGGMDGYFAMLGRSTRKDLRRRQRAGREIEIVKTDDPTPYLDQMMRLYQMQIQQVDLVFGQQRREFFAQVTRRVPGSYYVLYFKNHGLIAFNLLIGGGQTLVDKYFAMDPELGRYYGLYFISWLYNVETCFSQNMTVYHAGSGSEATKARLGCRFIATSTRFQHRNHLMNRGLSLLARSFAYTPQVDVAKLSWPYAAPHYGPLGKTVHDHALTATRLAS